MAVHNYDIQKGHLPLEGGDGWLRVVPSILDETGRPSRQPVAQGETRQFFSVALTNVDVAAVPEKHPFIRRGEQSVSFGANLVDVPEGTDKVESELAMDPTVVVGEHFRSGRLRGILHSSVSLEQTVALETVADMASEELRPFDDEAES